MFPEKFGSNIFAPIALSFVFGILIADVVVIVTFVRAVEHTAISKVVLFVASGGGGSQARPNVFADWRLLACSGWRSRAPSVRVATWDWRYLLACLAGERGGVLALAIVGMALGLATRVPFGVG